MTLSKNDVQKRGVPHEEYFRMVSPMCRKILDEMASIKESYGDDWKHLTYDEQCKIMDQAIVDEATVRRYETGNASQLDLEYFPKLKLATGQKIVSDDKLTARGYSCIWRDEHSAPFSWHTRSQMDLTLDTPPPTPTLTNEESDTTTEKSKTPKSETNSLFSRQVYKTQPFLWHYDPRSDARPPDSPDLVVASSLSKAPSSEPLINSVNTYNHVVVRDDVDSGGVSGWMKGAFNFFAGSCIPLQSFANKKTHLHPGSPFMHPELRPPHVIAKAAKAYAPVTNQPKTPVDMLKSTSKDSTRDISSIDTSFTVCDTTSEGSTEGRISSAANKTAVTNRNSIINAITSPSDNVYTITEERTNINVGANDKSKLKNVASFETYCSADYPLSMMQSEESEKAAEPGFDFLYNW